MKNYVNLLFKKVILASFVSAFGLGLMAQEVEEVVVTAEKRSESLQDISQAVTALSESDIEEKNIESLRKYARIFFSAFTHKIMPNLIST